MKFLIDRYAGRRLADWLPAAGTMSLRPENSALIPVIVRCWTAPRPRGGLS